MSRSSSRGKEKSKGASKSTSIAPTNPYDDIKYRARDALQTLARADEIKRDRPLMKEVKKCAKQQMKATQR